MPVLGPMGAGGGGAGGGGHEFVDVVPEYADAREGLVYIRRADLTPWIRGTTTVEPVAAYIERSDVIPTAADATYLGVLAVEPGQATADTTFRLFYYDTNFEAVRYDSRTIAAYTTLANHGALRDLFGYATTQDGGWLAVDTALGEGLYADEAAALAFLNGKQGDADFYVGAVLYRDVREWIYFNEAEHELKRLIIHAAVAGGVTNAMVQFGGTGVGGGATNTIIQTIIDRDVKGDQLFHSDTLPVANQAASTSPIDLTWIADDLSVSIDGDEIHLPSERPTVAFGILVEAEVDGSVVGSVIVPWGGAGQYFSNGMTFGLQGLRLSDNQLIMVGTGGQLQGARPSPWNGTWELAVSGGGTTIPADTIIKGYIARAAAVQRTTTTQFEGDRLTPRESIDAAHPDALGAADVGTIFNINGQLEECVRMVHVEPAVPATWNTWADGDDVSAYWPDLSGPIIFRGVHNRGTDVGIPVDGNVYVVGGTGQWEFYQPTTGGVFGPIHGWVNVRDPNGWINRTLHNQDEADDYATMVGNVALWGGAVHNCLTLEIPDASSISYPLILYRRLANPPVLEFWGKNQTSRNNPLDAGNSYILSTIRSRALFNTTPAMLLFGATADLVDWLTADEVTDEDITTGEVVPEGHYFHPSAGVWNVSVFYGANSSLKETSLRFLKVMAAGIDNVILLRAFPETAPAVGLGDPDYHGISMRYDYLKVEDGDVFSVLLEGNHPTTTVWAILFEKVA